MILYENLRNISSKRRCLKIYEFNFRNKLILTDEFFEFVHKYIREVKRTEFQVIHYHKMLVTISLFGKEGEDARYGNTGCGVFKLGGTKLERFLPRNQHTQRKLLNFEN